VPRALSVRTSIHGRVLVEDAASDPAGLLLAFHGYGQGGEEFLQDVLKIPGASRWRVASLQALHRFYAREERVVASWMTRQDREESIADNIAYVDASVDTLLNDGSPNPARIVCLGFSQGASMAYRAALAGRRRASGVIALAGDIPPEIKSSSAPSPWPRVLIGVGDRETWYVGRKLDDDIAFLTERGVDHQVVRFAGGHEWTAEFCDAAARWLESVASTPAESDPMVSRSR
jgi:predicted esterase